MGERTQHNWKAAPSGRNWICESCGKLDFSIFPDLSHTCVGNITQVIENEVQLNTNTDPAQVEFLKDGETYWLGAIWAEFDANNDVFLTGNAYIHRADTWFKNHPVMLKDEN